MGLSGMEYVKKILILTICCSFLFFSCGEEEMNAEKEIELSALPVNALPYLIITASDDRYNFSSSTEEFVYSQSGSFPVDTDATPELGIRVQSDTPEIDFFLGYKVPARNRNELIEVLIKPEGEIAYDSYTNGKFIKFNRGFLIEIGEYEYSGGPGKGFTSLQTEQPDDSFFEIKNYYAGESEYTIWLEGTFKLSVEKQQELITMNGEFLLQFPVCCFD